MAARSRFQDVNVPLLFTIGGLGTVLLIVIVVGIQAWFRWEVQRELQAKVFNVPFTELEQIKEEQLANLDGQAADAEGATAKIPIEQAMEMVVRRYTQPEQPATP